MKNNPVQNRVGLVTSSVRRDHRLNQYEVSPTYPGPDDKDRDKQISSSIAKWKTQHTDVKTH